MPGNLQADYYILSMNKTDRYYVSQERYLATILRMVNSSQTSITVSRLPVFSQYLACVYLVDSNGEIYKSEKIDVETDESGKLLL